MKADKTPTGGIGSNQHQTKGVSKQLLKQQEESTRFAKEKSDVLRQEQRDRKKTERLAKKRLRRANWMLKKRGRQAELDFQRTFQTNSPVVFDTGTYRFSKDVQSVKGVESDSETLEGEATFDLNGDKVDVRVRLSRKSDYLGWGALVKSWDVSFWYKDREMYSRRNLETHVGLDKLRGGSHWNPASPS